MIEIDDQEASRGAPPGKSGASLAQLEQWLAGAQPNSRRVYFTGFCAGDGDEALNRRLQQEQARGMVYLMQGKPRPDGGGRDYIAVRSSRPAAADRPRPRPTLDQQAEALFKRGGR